MIITLLLYNSKLFFNWYVYHWSTQLTDFAYASIYYKL